MKTKLGGDMNNKLNPFGIPLIYSNPGKIMVTSSPKKKDYFSILKVKRVIRGKPEFSEYAIVLKSDGKYHTELDMRGFGTFKTLSEAQARVKKSMKNLLYSAVGTWKKGSNWKPLNKRVGSSVGKLVSGSEVNAMSATYNKLVAKYGIKDAPKDIKGTIYKVYSSPKYSKTYKVTVVDPNGDEYRIGFSGSPEKMVRQSAAGYKIVKMSSVGSSVGKRLPLNKDMIQNFGIATLKTKEDAQKVALKIRKLGFKTRVEPYKDSGGGDITFGKWEVVVTIGQTQYSKWHKLENLGEINKIINSVRGTNKGVNVGMKHKKGKRGKSVGSPVGSFVIAEILANPGRKNILELKNVKSWIKTMATKHKLNSSEISHRLNQAMAKAGIVATTTSKSIRNAIKKILPKAQRWMGTKYKSAKTYKKATTSLARVRKTPKRGSSAAKSRGKKVSKYWKTVPNFKIAETVGRSIKSKRGTKMSKRRKSSHKRKVGEMFVSKSSHKRRVGEMFVSSVGRSHKSHKKAHKSYRGIGASIGKVNVKKTGSDMLNKAVGIVAGTNLAGLIKQGTDMLFKTKTATGNWQTPVSNAAAGIVSYFGADFLGKMLKAPQSIIEAAKVGSVMFAIRAIPTIGDKLVKVESGIEGYIESVAESVAGQLENFRSQGSPDDVYPTEGSVSVDGQLISENRLVSLQGIDLDAEIGDEVYPGEEYPVANQ